MITTLSRGMRALLLLCGTYGRFKLVKPLLQESKPWRVATASGCIASRGEISNQSLCLRQGVCHHRLPLVLNDHNTA